MTSLQQIFELKKVQVEIDDVILQWVGGNDVIVKYATFEFSEQFQNKICRPQQKIFGNTSTTNLCNDISLSRILL